MSLLRIKIYRTYDGLVLYQSYYIEEIMYKFFKGDNSSVKTTINIRVYMSKNKGKRIS